MAVATYYARLVASPNGSGATGGGSQTKSSPEGGVTLSFSVNYSASRQYYIFKGWSTSSSGSVNVGSTITVTTSMTDGETNTRTIYAVWAHATAVLTYNANGGSGAPSAKTVNQNEYFRISTTTPTKAGHTFKGWGTTSSATTASYQPNDLARIVGNMTLYAVWEANTYTISYNANGGSGAPSAQTKTYGVSLTLSSTVPTRSGYTFLGWSTSNTATSATYSAGGTYTSNSGATLYAVWQKTLTLSYDANSGSGAPSSQSKTIVNATSATFTISSTTPTRTNYNFLGWATSSSATSASYSSGDSITISSNTTLYAVWELATRTFTLSYNANGGSGAPSSQSKTVTATSATFTISSTAPTRTGYTFKGWATSSSSTTATYASGGSITISANTTLYAVWKIITYTVSYDANSGTGEPSSQTKTYGVTLTLSSTAPTRTGYTFLGWATSASATTATYSAGDNYTTNASVTLYAVWQAITYTVTFNANGGVNAPASQAKTHGVNLVLSSAKPTRAGYIFQGWGTSSSATTVSYASGSTYKNNANITLYAIWSVVTYIFSFAGTGDGVDLTAYVSESGTLIETDIFFI